MASEKLTNVHLALHYYFINIKKMSPKKATANLGILITIKSFF